MVPADTINRRAHPRYKLPPMYTSVVAARNVDGHAIGMVGHAYDISESGIRIELDVPLSPGEVVALHVELPGESVDVNTNARVIWLNDAEDDPGPRRMALQFTDFGTPDDHERLIRYLGHGTLAQAA